MLVAICDDDNKDLAMLSSTLQAYNTSSLEVFPFSDAKSLLNSTSRKLYDIVILDIEMPQINGYDAAKMLISSLQKPLIIFLTNSMAYTLRGYGVAFRYLTKPIDKSQLFAAMDAAIREVKANRFVFTSDGCDHVIHMDEIYYLEIFNHHIILHTMDCEYTFRSTLKEILTQLPCGYFGMPHQSYIINFQHIKTAASKEIHLTNGVSIPVSRRRQKDFDSQLHLYLGR